jgi:hypothetical protein
MPDLQQPAGLLHELQGSLLPVSRGVRDCLPGWHCLCVLDLHCLHGQLPDLPDGCQFLSGLPGWLPAAQQCVPGFLPSPDPDPLCSGRTVRDLSEPLQHLSGLPPDLHQLPVTTDLPLRPVFQRLPVLLLRPGGDLPVLRAAVPDLSVRLRLPDLLGWQVRLPGRLPVPVPQWAIH